MSGFNFLPVLAKLCKVWLVIPNGVVVDVANEGVGKGQFAYFLICVLDFLREIFLLY